MKKIKSDVGKRFAAIRKDRSYRAFAKDCSISESLLQRYETGGGMPGVENLAVLYKRENINLNWLVCGKGAMTN